MGREYRKKQGLRKVRFKTKDGQFFRDLVTGEKKRFRHASERIGWCRCHRAVFEYVWFERNGRPYYLHKSECLEWEVLPVQPGDWTKPEELAAAWEKYFRPPGGKLAD